MGLILDTSILIAAERCGEGVEDLFYRARAQYGEVEPRYLRSVSSS